MTQEEFFKRYSYSPRQDKLGGGAFGTVYKAYDNYRDIYVAIKISEVKIYGDKEFSLLEEYDTVKKLPPHPNVAFYEDVYNFESHQGVFDYAILQYYPEGNLSDLIKKKILTPEQEEDIALQILEGLSFLHKHNVVHRDMKPSNILIHKRKNGRYIPKIADFGLSKKADTKQSRFTNSFGGGTLEYSSPEQLKGQTLRFNTDLWAWAVITYELFTSEMLFKPKGSHSTGNAEREKELYEQILSKEVVESLKCLPKKWQEALSMCLVRNADERAKTAEDVKEVLQVSEGSTDFATKILEPTEPTDETTQILNPIIEKTQVVVVEEPEVIIDKKYLKNKYDDIGKFSEGLAPVRLNGKWGFIDKTGKEVVHVKYDYVWHFSEGLAKVQLNGKWGFIDKIGKEVISIKYDYVRSFSEGLAVVNLNGKWGLIDKTGRHIVSAIYEDVKFYSDDLVAVQLNGRYGFIDKERRDEVSTVYDDVKSYSDDLVAVQLNGKWGFIDKERREVIPPIYNDVKSYSEGLAPVLLKGSWFSKGKWTIIDKIGREVIQAKYDDIHSYSEGLAAVRFNKKWGFIDKKGRVVISIIYNDVRSFSGGLAAVRFNKKWGFIDKTGKCVVSLIYNDVHSFSDGLATVNLNGRWGFVNEKGEEIIPIGYDYVLDFNEGLGVVSINKNIGYVDKQGNEYFL